MVYQRRLPTLLLTFILCCGVIGPGDGIHSMPHRIKRQEPEIEHVDGATLFIVPSYRGITQPQSNAQRTEARDLINLFDNQHVGRTQQNNLVRFRERGRTQTLRIDLQRKVHGYYNLQMQINRPRNGQDTSLTLVLAPDGISAANMRTAFIRSLARQARVCVENGRVEASVNCPGINTGQGGSNGKGNNNSKGKGKGKGNNNRPRGKVGR